VCVLDIDAVKVYCAKYTDPQPDSRVGFSFIDYSMVSKAPDVNGKRYVFLAANPAAVMYSINREAGRLDYEYRAPEHPDSLGNKDGICDPNERCFGAPHADLMAGADGRTYLVHFDDFSATTAGTCGRYLVVREVAERLRPIRVMHLFKCGGVEPWASGHFGCAKRASACAVSTDTTALADPLALTPPLKATYEGESMLLRGTAFGWEFLRAGKTRSQRFTTDSYWSTPRTAISPNGRAQQHDSNFCGPLQYRPVITPLQ